MCGSCEVAVCSVPTSGYATLWPYRDLGKSEDGAFAVAGARPQRVATRFAAVRSDGSRIRIDVPSEIGARKVAARSVENPVVLARYIGPSPIGDLYRFEELIFESAVADVVSSRKTSFVVDGVLVGKNANPYGTIDIRALSKRLTSRLTSLEAETLGPAMERYLAKLSVDWTRLTPARIGEVLRDARDTLVKMSVGSMVPAWSKRVRISVEDVAAKTKTVLREVHIPSLQASLRQPELMAVDRIATQSGWFLRDHLGKRSDALTARGRDIVQRGLSEGLGKREIARELERQLPGLAKQYGKQYATVAASAAVSRARSYAEVMGYREVGITYYEVQAVLDERTTEICRSLDGTVLAVDDAMAQIDRVVNMSGPEDIYREAPFLEVKKKGDDRILQTRVGAEIGRIERSGFGRVDDRGRVAMFRGGSQMARVNVGPPPYHHLCRSWTVPRVDVVQVPRGYSVRSLPDRARLPAGTRGGPSSLRPLETFRNPSKKKPKISGSDAPVADYLLPRFLNSAAPTIARAVDGGRIGLRGWGHAVGERRFESVSKRMQVMRPDGLKSTKESGVGVDSVSQMFVPRGTRDRHLGRLLGNPEMAGRELLIRVSEADGAAAEWVRFRGHDAAGWRRRAEALAKARGGKVDDAARALIREGEAKGWIERSKVLDDIAPAQTARVQSRGGGSATSPRRSAVSAKPTARQPDHVEQPKPDLQRGGSATTRSLREVPMKAEVYSARPASQEMVAARWDDETFGLYSKMRVADDGSAAAQSKWEKIKTADLGDARGARPNLTDLKVGKADQVVHVYVPKSDIHLRGNNYSSARMTEQIMDIERKADGGAARDWILQNERGESLFIRVDRSAVRALNEVEYRRALASIYNDNPAVYRKLGLEVTPLADELYPQMVVDWRQRNWIAGVPLKKQVTERVAAVRAEIGEALKVEADRLGRPLKGWERGGVIQRVARRDATKRRASEHLRVSKIEGAGKKEQDVFLRREMANSDVDSRTVKIAGKQIEKDFDGAMSYCSEGVLSACQTKVRPVFMQSSKDRHRAWHRADSSAPERGSSIFVGNEPAASLSRTVTHETQHYVDTFGYNGPALREVRNRLVTEGRVIDLYGGKRELALPGRWVDNYDGRVYGSEKIAAEKEFGKDLTKRKAASLGGKPEEDLSYSNELGSMSRERMDHDGEIGLNWALQPDQVSILISVLRGHFVPF